MSKKTRKKRERRQERAKGKSRSEVVLSIVATDSTFTRHPSPRVVGFMCHPVDIDLSAWVGKCIHCGGKLVVAPDGTTSATVEHIDPLCNGGDKVDPRNLALAHSQCNSEKGVRHDQHVGKGGRADEVIATLQAKRLARWRDPVPNS